MPKIKVYRGFPPIIIPEDGSTLGIEQLKNIIDLSVEARRRHEKHAAMKKGLMKRINGWFLGAWYGGVTLKDIVANIEQIWNEVKDLDVVEIGTLIDHIQSKHNLDKDGSRKLFSVFKNILRMLKDGKIEISELKDIEFLG